MAVPDNQTNSFWNNTRPFEKNVVKALKRLEKNNGTLHGHSVQQISAWMRENCDYNNEDLEPKIRNTLRKMSEKYVVIRKEEKRILWKMSGYCNCTKCSTKKKMHQSPPLLCDNPSTGRSQGNSRPNYHTTTNCRSRAPCPRSREIDQKSLRRSYRECGVPAYLNRNGNSSCNDKSSRMGSNSLHRHSSGRRSRTNIQGTVYKSSSTNSSTSRKYANIYKSGCNKGETHRKRSNGCHSRAITLIQKRPSPMSSHSTEPTDSDGISSTSRPKRQYIQENDQSSTHGLTVNKRKREDLQLYLPSSSAECTGTHDGLGVNTSQNVQKATTSRSESNNCENKHIDFENHNKDNDGDDYKNADYEEGTYGYETNDTDDTSRCGSNIDNDTFDEYQVPAINNDADIDGEGYDGVGNLEGGDDVYNSNGDNDNDGEDNDAKRDSIMCCIL